MHVTVDETRNEVKAASVERRHPDLPCGRVFRGRDDCGNATATHRDIGITELARALR